MLKGTLFAAVGALIGLLVQTGAVQAQATRTWVSGVGDDANPCSRTAPCKTFAGAISKTAASGEISVLDPGGFGAVTITKSISIVSEGSEGSILNAATTGININGAGIIVNLHGLFIEGAGSGINGIRIIQAGRVLIRHSLIRGNQGGAAAAGILVDPSTTVHVTVQDSTISRNNNGVLVKPTGSAVANVHLQRVVVDGNNAAAPNGFGVKADGANAVVLLNENLIRGNGTGVGVLNGGTIDSFQTNIIKGNFVANGAPTVNSNRL